MKYVFIAFAALLLNAKALSQDSLTNIPAPYFSAVIVSNIDSSLIWYQTVLKLKVRNRIENPERGSKIAVLERSGVLVELIEVKTSLAGKQILKDKPPRTLIQGFSKIGFRVTDLDRIHIQLAELGVKFFGNVFRDPFSSKRSFLVSDPDGNLVQFFE